MASEFERLVDSLMPALEVPSPAVLEEARREAIVRRRILRDFGAFRASELADVAGSLAGNRSQVAYRLRKEKRIFAVPHRGTWWYLGFQFDEAGRPRPVIAEVLAHIGDWPPWEIARWFVARNPLLDRRAPLELMTDASEEVVRAAERDAAGSR
jgi:hypothetical protein